MLLNVLENIDNVKQLRAGSCYTPCSNTFRSVNLCTPDAHGSDKVGTESQLEDKVQMSIAI